MKFYEKLKEFSGLDIKPDDEVLEQNMALSTAILQLPQEIVEHFLITVEYAKTAALYHIYNGMGNLENKYGDNPYLFEFDHKLNPLMVKRLDFLSRQLRNSQLGHFAREHLSYVIEFETMFQKYNDMRK